MSNKTRHPEIQNIINSDSAVQMYLPLEYDSFWDDADKLMEYRFYTNILDEDIKKQLIAVDIYKTLLKGKSQENNENIVISESQKQIDSEVEMMDDGVDPRTDN